MKFDTIMYPKEKISWEAMFKSLKDNKIKQVKFVRETLDVGLYEAKQITELLRGTHHVIANETSEKYRQLREAVGRLITD